MSTRLVLLGAVLWAGAAPASTPAEPRPEPLRIGIIGVDTSHAVAFTQILNDPKDPEHIEGARRGTPLLCGAERGMASAVATLAGHEAVATKTRVDVAESPDRVS